MSLVRWPWRRLPPPVHELEESRRALQEAKAWEVRTRRLSTATERAIVQNHFGRDIRKAMERQ